MDFLAKLDFLMEQRKLNKNMLSSASGIPYTTIDGFYKKGYENVKLSTLEKLASFFGVALDFLVRDEIIDPDYGKAYSFAVTYNEMKGIEKYRTLDEHGRKMVDIVLDEETNRFKSEKNEAGKKLYFREPAQPIRSTRLSYQKTSAGTGVYLGPEEFETIHVYANKLPKNVSFCVPVDGDSMEPRYRDGDILIVSNEPVEVGQIGIFTMEGEGYVKKLGRGVLHSLNPEYEDKPFTEDIRCNGKVVGVLDPADIVDE